MIFTKEDFKADLIKTIEMLLIPHDVDLEKEELKNYFTYINSIRFIELITLIEHKYNIEFDSKDLTRNNTKTIEDFCNLVEKYLK